MQGTHVLPDTSIGAPPQTSSPSTLPHFQVFTGGAPGLPPAERARKSCCDRSATTRCECQRNLVVRCGADTHDAKLLLRRGLPCEMLRVASQRRPAVGTQVLVDNLGRDRDYMLALPELDQIERLQS
mmetsp:Transcript_48575/g.134733  ORF Transcript_48575/g.134733 Transcript_48575/m.134733 type:complete len:127 (+) Transcript_48575:141-521(+)